MKKLLLGILLGVAAFAVPAFAVFSLIRSLSDETAAFKAPGQLEVTVEEPGRYYVWNEHQTIFEGRTYSEGKTLPGGVTFSLESVETGETVPFQGDLSITFSTGQREMASVGYFEIEEPGDYVLEIAGLDRPRIFSFGKSVFENFFTLFGQMLLVLLFALAAFVGGVLLIVFGILELVRKDEKPPPLPHAWER